MEIKVIYALLILIILINGCIPDVDLSQVREEDVEQIIECESPYIKNNGDCCLDVNEDGICDVDEGIITEEPIEEAQPVPCEYSTNLLIGDYCCEYSEEHAGLCKDEVDLYLKRKEESYNQYRSTGKMEVIKDWNLYYVSPENWYVLKDYKMGNMYVPISYMMKDEKGREVEIRFARYENKEGLSIEEFKKLIVDLLSRERVSKIKMPKSEDFPYKADRMESKYDEGSGIWFDLWRYGKWDEYYYRVEILEKDNSFYLVLIMDPIERKYVGSFDEPWSKFNELGFSLRFIEHNEASYKINFGSNLIYRIPVGIDKPIKLHYEVKSDKGIYFYILKDFEEMDKFLKVAWMERRFEYYEDCFHDGIKEIEGECIIEYGYIHIGNRAGTGDMDFVLDLSWEEV